jgi:hypothetical protein
MAFAVIKIFEEETYCNGTRATCTMGHRYGSKGHDGGPGCGNKGKTERV